MVVATKGFHRTFQGAQGGLDDDGQGWRLERSCADAHLKALELQAAWQGRRAKRVFSDGVRGKGAGAGATRYGQVR